MNPSVIFSRAQMLAAEQRAVSVGTPLSELMERAGAAVAQQIQQRFSRRPVVVWCGPGNNGGDGYVAARHLREAGWDVRVEALDAPSSDLAQAAAAQWLGDVRPLDPKAGAADALYVDALFGAGLARPLAGPALAAARLSKSQTVVAIDLPSGLSDDQARPVNDDCVQAKLTIALHRRRLAHLLNPGVAACGEVVLVDIGIPAGDADLRLWENTPELWRDKLNWPTVASHKHSRGRLVVVGGPAWRTGAACSEMNPDTPA